MEDNKAAVMTECIKMLAKICNGNNTKIIGTLEIMKNSLHLMMNPLLKEMHEVAFKNKENGRNNRRTD